MKYFFYICRYWDSTWRKRRMCELISLSRFGPSNRYEFKEIPLNRWKALNTTLNLSSFCALTTPWNRIKHCRGWYISNCSCRIRRENPSCSYSSIWVPNFATHEGFLLTKLRSRWFRRLCAAWRLAGSTRLSAFQGIPTAICPSANETESLTLLVFVHKNWYNALITSWFLLDEPFNLTMKFSVLLYEIDISNTSYFLVDRSAQTPCQREFYDVQTLNSSRRPTDFLLHISLKLVIS